MQISEVTRRNIMDELSNIDLPWYGRLNEVDFLIRVFPLQEMPSTDVRFANMAGDIYQHRINNFDWEDNWIFDDPRINLLKCDDKIFLDFLCEIIHPVVRANALETEQFIKIFNTQLEADGYEICEIRKISGRPIFSARLITNPVIFEDVTKIDSDFVKNQILKCDSKLKERDYDGAISSARSLVEGILGEIYLKCTGTNLPETGDLLKDYKKIKDLLNLSEEKYSQDGFKSIIRSFNGIIQNIDALSNKMGDRHRPLITPARHHAKLVVDSAKTISSFLFSSMEYQSNRKNTFLNQLLDILDSDKRHYSKEKFKEDEEIKDLFSSSDVYLRQIVKEEFFDRFEVHSFRQSDIFFAVMRLFIEELTINDIVLIFTESMHNNQMVGWKEFEKELLEIKPNILADAYKQLYEK